MTLAISGLGTRRKPSFEGGRAVWMGDTYAMPTLAERRAEPAARIAHFARIAQEHDRQFAGVPFEERDWHLIAMCNACGQNTGSWCDHCESAGRRFTTVWGQEMAGSPLCTRCEGDRVTCNVCGRAWALQPCLAEHVTAGGRQGQAGAGIPRFR